MTGIEMKLALQALGLTHSGFGRLLGIDGRTVRKWGSGALPVPGPVRMIVRLLLLIRRDGGGGKLSAAFVAKLMADATPKTKRTPAGEPGSATTIVQA